MAQPWVSPHEVPITEETLEIEAALRTTDAAIGASAHERYGRVHEPLPLPRRIQRALEWRIRRVPAAETAVVCADKVRRRLAREATVLGRRVRDVAPAASHIVVALEPATAAEANAFLHTTWAAHIVFLRDGAVPIAAGLRALADAIAAHPNAVLLCGDAQSATGRHLPAPAFAHLRLREDDTLGGAVVVNVARVRAMGGFDAADDGAVVFGLALRLADAAVVRVPTELAVVRGHPDEEAQRRVVARHLADRGVAATVTAAPGGGREVRYPVVGTPLVSVIIPTRGSAGRAAGATRVYVTEAVRDLVERSTYPHCEFVVVADADVPQSVADDLAAIAGDRLRLIRWDAPFDFSAKINRGAAVARGDVFLVLNDDVALVTCDAVERMLGLVQQPDIGIVGALLFFEDGRVQHLGQVYDSGTAGHAAIGIMPGVQLPWSALSVTRVCSGVTAACAMMTRETYIAVGGYSEVFPNNYNDVDFCMKVRERGLLAVCCGRTRWYHFESVSRDARVRIEEVDRLQDRWWAAIRTEEYARVARR